MQILDRLSLPAPKGSLLPKHRIGEGAPGLKHKTARRRDPQAKTPTLRLDPMLRDRAGRVSHAAVLRPSRPAGKDLEWTRPQQFPQGFRRSSSLAVVHPAEFAAD